MEVLEGRLTTSIRFCRHLLDLRKPMALISQQVQLLGYYRSIPPG